MSKMISKEKNFVSAVLYVHNAENRIEAFLKQVIQVLETNFEHSEIICVNDYSDDASASKIKAVSAEAESVSISILNLSYYHGLEVAMNAGVDLAIGDFVFEFDNTVMDFETEEIMRVYRHSLEGFDIVNAAPDRKQKLSSSLFYFVFDKFSDLSYKMTTESFRILSRRAINRISSMNKSVLYRKAVYSNCGLKMDTVTYAAKSYDRVVDKREKKYRRGMAINSLILFTDAGYRFSITMTCLMMFVSIFMMLYTVISYFVIHPVEGWTTTILFLSVAFFGLFGILTVIIRYLQILVELIFKRKRYSFESIEKLTK